MHSVGAAMRTDFYDADYTSLLGTHDAEYYVFDTETSMAFGLASSDEMCIHFLLYYPALEHILGSFCGQGICGGFYGADMVDDVSRSFGSSCSSSSTTEATDENVSSTTEATSLAAACALHTAAISVFFVGAHFGPTL